MKQKKILGGQNKYLVYLGRMKGNRFVVEKRVEFQAPTHVLAAKAVEIQYPDMKVASVVQRWFPLEACHNCGAPIFTGDFTNDQIVQREGSNRCLECCPRKRERS